MLKSVDNNLIFRTRGKSRDMLFVGLAIMAFLNVFTKAENAFADGDSLLPATETCNGLYVFALNSSGTCDSAAECDTQRNCPDVASGCGFHVTKKCQDTMDFDCDGIADDVEYSNPPADPTISLIAQVDTDNDRLVDRCDPDDDDDTFNDFYPDGITPFDNCRLVANDQVNTDGDAFGDACDTCIDVDSDGYGAINLSGCPGNPAGPPAATTVPDNCPHVSNPDQADIDNNGLGDACDNAPDADLDGVPDSIDQCRTGISGWTSDPATNDLDADGCRDMDEDSCVDQDNDGFGSEPFDKTGCTGEVTVMRCGNEARLLASETYDICPDITNIDQSNRCGYVYPPCPPSSININ